MKLLLAFIIFIASASEVAYAQNAKRLPQFQLVDEINLSAYLPPEKVVQFQKLKKSRGIKNIRVVKIDVALASASTISVPLGDGTYIEIIKKSEVRKTNNDLIWNGTVSGGGEAVFVFKDGEVGATIDRQGRLIEIRTLGKGMNVLLEVDRSTLPPDHPAEYPSGTLKDNSNSSRTKESFDSGGTARQLSSTGAPTIDVLILYTASAATNLGAVNVASEQAAARMNNSFANSAVNLNIQISATLPVSSEFTSSINALEALGPNTALGIRARQWRNQYLADIIVLVATFSDACGLARAQGAAAEFAYTVIDASCFLGNLTFSHEIGHLIGAAHNAENDMPPTLGSGHGYHTSWAANYAYFPAKNHVQCWHTIMSYQFAAFDRNNSCSANAAGATDPRINYWSNPNIFYTDSAPNAINGFGGVAEAGPTKTLPTGTTACCNTAATLNANGARTAALSNTPLAASFTSTQTVIEMLILN